MGGREGSLVSIYGAARRLRGRVPAPEATLERELLDRVGQRDLQAFEKLYREYQPRLSRFLINLVQHPLVVEEVLNDTMVVVWQSADKFRGESKVSTWIFSIAYRKALKARGRPQPLPDEASSFEPSPEPGPDQQVNAAHLRDALAAAMNKLSADHRAVVDLTYFHNLGYREIAEIMDCPIDTVKTRMFHARRRLRAMISGTLSDWL